MSHPEEAAKIIVDIADDLIGWDACSVYLYSAQNNIGLNLLHMDIIDGERQVVQPIQTNEPPGVLPKQTIDEDPQLILRDEPKFDTVQADPFGDRSRPSASLMFPLRAGNRVTGILSIQSYTLYAYEKGDLQLLQALGDHCSGALERTRVEQALRDAQVSA